MQIFLHTFFSKLKTSKKLHNQCQQHLLVFPFTLYTLGVGAGSLWTNLTYKWPFQRHEFMSQMPTTQIPTSSCVETYWYHSKRSQKSHMTTHSNPSLT